MQGKYTNIKDFEKELLDYLNQGHTLRETGEKYGFTYKEMRDFKTRYNKNQRKIAAGIEIKPKGRPRKDGTKLPPSPFGSCGRFAGVFQLPALRLFGDALCLVFRQRPTLRLPGSALRLDCRPHQGDRT